MVKVITRCSASDSLLLEKDEIHIWIANLERDDRITRDLSKLLSEDEQIRAKNFYFEKDRVHFIISHGILRIILSRYVDQGSDQIAFIYGQYGKLSLKNHGEEKTINFNMSHSADLAIYAITCNRKIGIDIERIIEDFPCEEIAEKIFSPRENKDLLKIEAGKPRERSFYSCWTRKEAYIKARGEGLSMPLDHFDVSVSPHEPAKLLANRRDSKEVNRWTLMDLSPNPGFVSSLAVKGHGLRASYWII